jgi:hypothetical protein
MSICRGSIAPRIAFAFRMESFVCRRERTRYREPKSCPGDDPARQRRSELQAARGLRRSLRRSGGLQRLSLASALSWQRSHLGSFRSLACDEVVRAPTDPDPLDLDCGLSFRQGHCPPRPTLNVAPAGRKPGESGQVIQEEAPGSQRRGLREVVPEHVFPVFESA